MQLYLHLAYSITIVSTASLIYSLLSPSLIIFLLNINCTFSPPTSKWETVSPILGFLLKEDIGRYRGKLIGVLAARILLSIDNRGESTDIGDPY